MEDLALPEELDVDFYRLEYPFISKLDDQDVRDHYKSYGRHKGLNGNPLRTTQDLISIIPDGASVLEIGPFYDPMVRGKNVSYFDVIDRDEMIKRAVALGVENPNPPEITYVSETADLSVINDTFDFVISKFCIEHQTDFVGHLQEVDRLLKNGGRYFVIAPDKRYCHDHFKPESTTAEILDAHLSKRTTHPLRAIILQGMNTHNEPWRHWANDHGKPVPDDHLQQIRYALFLHERADGGYVDSHSWYMTPNAMRAIMADLNELGYSDLTLERCYETRKNTYEFWSILRKKT